MGLHAWNKFSAFVALVMLFFMLTTTHSGVALINVQSGVPKTEPGVVVEGRYDMMITNDDCDRRIGNCRTSHGSCVYGLNNKLECKCPEDVIYKMDDGCKITEHDCDRKFANCRASKGSCVYGSNNEMECQCPDNAIYNVVNGCEKGVAECQKNCNPGICHNGTEGEICICPDTHVYKDDTCKDLCTAGNLPPGFCPNDACESHSVLGFRCKCEGNFTHADNNVTCRRKRMCSEGNGVEVCGKKSARCVEDLETGFKCLCSDAEEMDVDEVCKSKCDLKKYQDECHRRMAVCEMEGTQATCKCPPMLTFNEMGTCTELDPCAEGLCMNGGTCVMYRNTPKCICKFPFSGDKCEAEGRVDPKNGNVITWILCSVIILLVLFNSCFAVCRCRNGFRRKQNDSC